MRLFKKGAEIRLTREDIIAWLQHSLNSRFNVEEYKITKLILRPDAKYAAVISVEPSVKPIKKDNPS